MCRKITAPLCRERCHDEKRGGPSPGEKRSMMVTMALSRRYLRSPLWKRGVLFSTKDTASAKCNPSEHRPAAHFWGYTSQYPWMIDAANSLQCSFWTAPASIAVDRLPHLPLLSRGGVRSAFRRTRCSAELPPSEVVSSRYVHSALETGGHSSFFATVRGERKEIRDCLR